MAGKAIKAQADEADKKTKKKRRGHGEGTVYYREKRDDYAAQITVNGKRRTLTGKTQQIVIAKKKALEAEVAKGTYAEPSKTLLEIGLRPGLKPTVSW